MSKVSIVIPTYNGKKLLEKYLVSAINACKYYTLSDTEIIVVDDNSSDQTEDYLKSEYSFIRLIKQWTNKGFSVTANTGIFSAANEIVILLNNDVEVEKDFITHLPRHFECDDVFAIRPGLIDISGDKKIRNCRISGNFRYGFFDVPREIKKDINLAFFAGGGAVAYNRNKFVELGGFDEMFSPFYYEDVDLSYRAWKRGWKIVYEPKCLAYHQGGATISKMFNQDFVNTVRERNRYFLVWKNIADKKMLLQHFIFVPVRIIISLVKGRIYAFTGFIQALKNMNTVIKKRNLEKQFIKISDREIFKQFD